MELFGRKKKEVKAEEADKSEKAADTAVVKSAVVGNATPKASVIIRPYITEKAAIATDNNVYTFVVTDRATKVDVKNAVKELYKKTPVKVTITKKPSKRVYRRDGVGVKSGLKKAQVYLKKGETIDVI